MNDETRPIPPTDDSLPGAAPDEIMPEGPVGAETVPEWLDRIRARRAAEAAARHRAEPPDEPDPVNVAASAPPESLPGWLRVAQPPAAAASASKPNEPLPPAVPSTTRTDPPPAAGEAPARPIPPANLPAPPMTSPASVVPEAVAAAIPPVDPEAEAPAWLKEAVAARAATPPAPSPAVPVTIPLESPPSAAQAEIPPEDAAAREKAAQEAARAARIRRRQERQARARRRSSLANTFQSLVVVAAAAAMIATIFTFWTPASFLSDETREGLRPAYATLSAQSPPTPIPTPIWMRRIGIVSGHWGPHPTTGRDDPGAVCPDGLTEASINRNVAQLVVQQLSGRGYDVDLLDEWDSRLNGYQASVLISIHADSCFQFSLPGATGFKFAAPSSRTSARADDLRLQECMNRMYAEVTGLPIHPSVTQDMTEYHNFGEISEVTPAGIIELGFMFEDRDILENRPDLLAEGIVSGLLCFLENAPPTPLPDLTPWPTLEATPTPLENPGLS